jgi:hypothetical protein
MSVPRIQRIGPQRFGLSQIVSHAGSPIQLAVFADGADFEADAAGPVAVPDHCLKVDIRSV